MIKEVVPFSKVLSTVVMVTFENFDISFGFRVFECEYSEFFGARDVLFYLHRP